MSVALAKPLIAVSSYIYNSLGCLDIVDARANPLLRWNEPLSRVFLSGPNLRKNLALRVFTISQATCSSVVIAGLSLNVFDPRFPFLLVDYISERRSLVITLIFQSFASTLFAPLVVW